MLCGACTGEDAAPAPRAQATGAVEVPPADPAPVDRPPGDAPGPAAPVDVAATCARLIGALPDALSGGELRRRPVTTDADRTAAWGDPAVLLRCGVPAPERLSEPFQLGPLDRDLVTFNVRDVGAAFLYTSVERTVNVSVQVPDAYPGTTLQPLTAPILDMLPLAAPG